MVRTHLCLAAAFSLCTAVAPLQAQDTEKQKTSPEPAGRQHAPAENAREAPLFIRLTRDREGRPARLQTAIVRYVPESGKGELVVDLIGAVHIGDRRYYKDLQEEFEQYDALLYELVKPDGVEVPDGTPEVPQDPLSVILSLGMDVLDLESQKDHIDYTRENFVHADLTPEQMMEAIEARGDDMLTLSLSLMADILRQQNLAERAAERGEAPPGAELPDVDPLELLVNPEAGMDLKRFLAEQLARDAGAGLGPTLETILIDDRNAACMRVFQRELARGKRKIGIFYGAAHLPDFDRRLREDFGLVREGTRWVTAWDLR